jgi:glycerate kinase
MDATLTVLIAPDSFKGSLAAAEAAAAIARGWRSLRPGDRLSILPQADGGEGTLDAIAAAVPDAVVHDAGLVTGPDGRPTPGTWLEVPGGIRASGRVGSIGVVELAQSSGLPLMTEPDPLGATTRGLGEVIRRALDHGIDSLVIGLGGSASTDGGAGALSALGLDLLGASGSPLADGGGALAALDRIGTGRLLPPPPGGVAVLADVTAPLLGPDGAAAVFGPQKGADPGGIRALEAGLSRFATLLGGRPDTAGAGAAGGAAYGFATAWAARIESGARFVQELTGLRAAIRSADVVLGGEGRFDATSKAGKVVGELLDLAAEHGVRAGVVAGQVATGPDAASSDAWTCSLSELAGTSVAAVADPVRYLERAGRVAAGHFTDIAG